jgi:hypothetical protein
MTAPRRTAQAWLRTAFPAIIALVPLAAPAQQVAGRSKPKPANPPELKRLEAKVDEVQESFLNDTSQLIKSFEDIGQYERAKVLLEALQKLDPKNEPVRDKLSALSRQILDANEFEMMLEPGKPWQPVGLVTQGQPLRVFVTGDYKLVTNVTATADGAPSDNPAEDLIAHVPFGAVMGVIANPNPSERPGGSGRGRQDDKQPRAFTIGSSYERPADRDGLLYIKVNVPPGAKCTGRLEAKISGATKP